MVLHRWTKRWAIGLALPLLTAAAEPMPIPQLPPPSARTFTLQSTALTIRPGQDTTYLVFSGGVSVTGKDFTLSADTVEVDVTSSIAMGGQGFKLPKKPESSERVVRDPGRAAAEMARELELPSANLTASAIKRVGAAGHVEVHGSGLKLSTGELVSTDGGRSWSAAGRSTISGSQAKTQQSYRLEADDLLFDTQTERAVARGNISGSFTRADDPPISVTAQRCELDLASQQLTASEGLTVTYGGVTLSCGDLSADFKASTLSASSSPRLTDTDNGLMLSATELSADLAAQQVNASGAIDLVSTAHGISLTAGQVSVNLKTKVLVASNAPLVRYRGSTYSGETITISDVDGKTVIEVTGEQQAHLDLDDLPDAQP